MKSNEEKEREKAQKWSAQNNLPQQMQNKGEGQCELYRQTSIIVGSKSLKERAGVIKLKVYKQELVFALPSLSHFDKV